MQEGKTASVCMVTGFKVEQQPRTFIDYNHTSLCFVSKLLTHVLLVKERLEVSNGAKQAEPRVGEGESSACSRPHTFLQR